MFIENAKSKSLLFSNSNKKQKQAIFTFEYYHPRIINISLEHSFIMFYYGRNTNTLLKQVLDNLKLDKQSFIEKSKARVF